MTTQRKLDGIYRGAGFHWVGDGFRVTNYFPNSNDLGPKISPYLLLDYHPPYAYEPKPGSPRGVGVHPHRGFETVTLAFEGSVAHHDSAGHAGVIGPGDVQWMTAASGVLHKEYHEQSFSNSGGTMHMAQIWINLPKAHKMDPPRYQNLVAAAIPRVELPDSSGYARVIAGQFHGAKGPALTFSPVTMLHLHLNANGHADLSIPSHENAALLVLEGEVRIHGQQQASALDLAVFAHDGEQIAIQSAAGAQVLLLAGEPIEEPVAQYGPFVMNTQEEIHQAIADFRNGRFGTLQG